MLPHRATHWEQREAQTPLSFYVTLLLRWSQNAALAGPEHRTLSPQLPLHPEPLRMLYKVHKRTYVEIRTQCSLEMTANLETIC